MCVSRLINFLPLALSTSFILLIPTQLPRFVSFPNTIPHTRRCMPSMNNPKHHLDHIQLITTAPNLRTDIFQSRRLNPKPTGLGRNIRRVALYLVCILVHIVQFLKHSTQSMFLMAEIWEARRTIRPLGCLPSP